MSWVTIGSQQWCDEWAAFYLKQAEKFSRLKYPGDEQALWYALLQWQWWKHREPWA